MPRPGRRAFAALLLAGASIAAPLITSAPASAAPIEIQLLTINDFHGRLQPDTQTGVPGVTKLATLVETVSLEAPTSFVSAGDNIGGSPFVSAAAQDQPTIDVLNEMGLDASAVGNHEFDKGFADLRDRVIPASDFPFLGANVRLEATGERALEDDFHIVDVGGVDVGYVGVVTEQTPSLVSPDGIAELTFTDPVAEAEAVAAELKDGNAANGEADVVVVLAHEGADKANITSVEDLQSDPVFGEFVAMSDDVDVIFSGHTHQPYAFEVPIPGTERTRPVISAEEYGKKLGRVKLTVDPDAGTVETEVAELLSPTAALPDDPEVKAIVDAAVAASAELGAVKIGEIDADILRGGNPSGSDRGVESVISNFIADAQLAGTAAANRGDAELAFMNAGGIRADFRYADNPDQPGDADGVVTYGEAFTVQSFSNDVITRTLTGAEIELALEQQWQPAGSSRPVLWLGVSEGFTYTYDPTAPQGERINPGSMRLNGVRIDPSDTVRVTTNSFLASGGDNFSALAGGTDRFTTGENDLAVLRAYFESFDGPVPVDREPRTFVAEPGQPDVVPFEDATDAVDVTFETVLGRTPSDAERAAWIAGIEDGSRTIVQLILENQQVELRDPAAQVTRIYLGLFGRPPSAADLDYWVGEMADGRSINSVAAFFARSAEFVALYGDTDDTEFVELVYENVLGRTASANDLEYWTGELERGVPRHRMFLLFSEAKEFRDATLLDMKVIDLYLSMLGRAPSGAELDSLTADLASGELTMSDIIDSIRYSDEYAEQFETEA